MTDKQEQKTFLRLDEDSRRALGQVYRLLLNLAEEAEKSEEPEEVKVDDLQD